MWILCRILCQRTGPPPLGLKVFAEFGSRWTPPEILELVEEAAYVRSAGPGARGEPGALRVEGSESACEPGDADGLASFRPAHACGDDVVSRHAGHPRSCRTGRSRKPLVAQAARGFESLLRCSSRCFPLIEPSSRAVRPPWLCLVRAAGSRSKPLEWGADCPTNPPQGSRRRELGGGETPTQPTKRHGCRAAGE